MPRATRQTRRPPARPAAATAAVRRSAGLTLLEVVFAVVLLAMVTTSIAGVSSFATRMQVRNEQTLGAYEVANRIILQYLDDRKQLPSESLPVQYGPHRYRYRLTEERVEMRANSTDAGRSAQMRAQNRFIHLTVRVWIVDERYGQSVAVAVAGEQLAELTRVLDPFASRNPDAQERAVNDPDFINQILQEIGGFGGAPQSSPSTTPGSGPVPGPAGGSRSPSPSTPSRNR